MSAMKIEVVSINSAINVKDIQTKVMGEAHPAANLFPLMSGDELLNLVISIKQFGFDPSKPIKRVGGKVYDGRNRQTAVEIVNAEVALWNTEHPGDQRQPINAVYVDETASDGDILAEVVRDNFTRRHLSSSQKAAVMFKMGVMSEAYAKRDESNARVKQEVAQLLASQHGVNTDYVYKVKAIAKAGSSKASAEKRKLSRELIDQIASGEISVMAAYAKINAAPTGTGNEGNTDSTDNPDAVKDGLGAVVPSDWSAQFKIRAKFAEAAKALSALRKLATEINTSEGGQFMQEGENLKNLNGHIANVSKAFRLVEPHAICPHCGGTGKDEEGTKTCPVCGGYGMVTKTSYDHFQKHGIPTAGVETPVTEETTEAQPEDQPTTTPTAEPTTEAKPTGKKRGGGKKKKTEETTEAQPEAQPATTEATQPTDPDVV